HARQLDVADCKVGRTRREAVERGGAVGIGHDAVTLRLERNRDRGENVAVVVNESDGRHGAPAVTVSTHGTLKPAKLGRSVTNPRQTRDSSRLSDHSWQARPRSSCAARLESCELTSSHPG